MAIDITRPTQAVILAGGRGIRLRPLTYTLPKPMVQFNGKPFLLYLIELLKEQGFEKVLLLLGYLPNIIIDYFGNGNSLGIKIDYLVTDADDETGKRLKHARHKLEQCFLLMYCDNYWPMNMNRMWEQFIKKKTAAQITVYRNMDNYTKNNLLLDDLMVVYYDKSRLTENLNGVDIGYAIIKKEVLDLLPDTNVNFEEIVYPTLVARKELFAYPTDHRYYSVGSHNRLKLTESFLQRPKAVILDRDGVLNKRSEEGMYVRNWSEFKWLDGSIEAVRLLKESGYYVIVITNQAGIARGIMTESDLTYIHERMKEELYENGYSLDAIYYCPHGWNDGCECRKPKPGMLFRAQRDFHLDLTRTFFVGDDIRDKQAGDAADCKTILLSPDLSLLQVVKEKILVCGK